MNFKGKGRKNKGITLIALVITIIVLLILAGVTINTLFGNESVLEKASEAKIKDEESSEFDSIKLAVVNAMAEGNNGKVSGKNLKSQLEGLVESTSGITDESTGSWTVKGKITGKNYTITENGNVTKEGEDGNPETEVVPKVGDTVNYAPSGSYEWDKALANSNDTGTEMLSSAEGNAYHITEWKILSYDTDTKMIEMVPSEPVGEVRLRGPQGYNNAVYLLNNACKSLYGNEGKGIEARSIKEKDFVEAGGEEYSSYILNYEGEYAIYGGRVEASYSDKTSKYYPEIYEKEKKSVIDEKENNDYEALEQSDQKEPIYASGDYPKGIKGKKEAEKSIHPYQTCYETKNYEKMVTLLGEKGEILLPLKDETRYWVATRCIGLSGEYSDGTCDYRVGMIEEGYFNPFQLDYSSSMYGGNFGSLFPVVSLNSELLVESEEPNVQWKIN